MNRILGLTAALAVAFSGTAQAQPTVDGNLTMADGYGAPIVTQSIQSGFGGGSQLAAAYAQVTDDTLYLFLAGAVEDNFNKWEIFIDSEAGGENTLSNVPVFDFMDSTGNLNGLTFDAGFTADHYLFVRRGNDNTFDVSFANIGAGATFGDYFTVLDMGETGVGMTPTTGPNATPIAVGFQNLMGAGIGADTGMAVAPGAAEAVTTGLELAISLADLGYTGGELNVSTFINGGNHDFVSNQVLGSLPLGTGNLGNDGLGNFIDGSLAGIDFNDFAGFQYFQVVPEPGTLALAGLAGLGMMMVGLRKRWG